MLSAGILIILLVVGGIQGRPDGADPLVCRNSAMNPEPGHGEAPQNGQSPYGVTVSADTYRPGGSLKVTLSGSRSFKGFLIMTLPANNENAPAVGSFDVVGRGRDAFTKPLCNGGATHTRTFSSNPRDRIILTWNAPSSAAGNLVFYATFVQNFGTYWVKVPSSVVRVGGSGGEGGRGGRPTNDRRRNAPQQNRRRQGQRPAGRRSRNRPASRNDIEIPKEDTVDTPRDIPTNNQASEVNQKQPRNRGSGRKGKGSKRSRKGRKQGARNQASTGSNRDNGIENGETSPSVGKVENRVENTDSGTGSGDPSTNIRRTSENNRPSIGSRSFRNTPGNGATGGNNGLGGTSSPNVSGIGENPSSSGLQKDGPSFFITFDNFDEYFNNLFNSPASPAFPPFPKFK